jgi:succinoglycan biosynthesis protein ExoL
VAFADPPVMMRIAFFGHDAGDAAVRRRVEGFRRDGLEVVRFMMRRSDTARDDETDIDLGRTFDANYLQRLARIFAGARIAAGQKGLLASSDVIYARNLDMLATAFLARSWAGLSTPVVYECLDVHRLLTRSDPIGSAMRGIEKSLLRSCRRLVVSSDAFIRRHFEARYGDICPAVLVENRMAPGTGYGPRPGQTPERTGPLRIGWVGVLRCARSLDLMRALVRQFGDAIHIDLHGMPALTEIPDFHERVSETPGMTFHGRYKAPEDLSRIYAGLDVVWAGDFMEAGFNSLWLLPNRLYEGGYYGVPAIAPQGTRTAEWIETVGAGFTLPEDLGLSLPQLIAQLIETRAVIAERREKLLSLPDDVFIQPEGELRGVIEGALGLSTTPLHGTSLLTAAERAR